MGHIGTIKDGSFFNQKPTNITIMKRKKNVKKRVTKQNN